MGAVPGRALARHTWSPPDVNASEDFTATTHGGPVTLLFLCAHKDLRLDEKQALRARLRAARRAHVAALPASMRGLVFLRPPSPVAALVPEGSIVGLYHAVGAEAPAGGYARWLLENGRSLALPWFANRESPMQFRRWADPFNDSDLEPGPWGALQPCAAADELTPGTVFVPLLGFTAAGVRLGQGGGHYDRWLEANPQTMALGLGWDCQLCDSLPIEPHDVHLRGVITPTRFYEGTR